MRQRNFKIRLELKTKLKKMTTEQKIEAFEEDLKAYREKELINAVVSIQKVFKKKRNMAKEKIARGKCIFEKDMAKLFVNNGQKVIVKCRVKAILGPK